MGSGCSSVNDSENPFELSFTKKERVLLRDTWSQLKDARQIIGDSVVSYVDAHAELKAVFGVQRVPRATMLQMPVLGGHVLRMTELVDQLTNLLGFMDNCLGALQAVQKVARAHANIAFLKRNRATNYFAPFSRAVVESLLPALVNPEADGDGGKRVRFGPTYAEPLVQAVWRRFGIVLAHEMAATFEVALRKEASRATLTVLAPAQLAEQADRRRRKLSRRGNDDNTAVNDYVIGASTENRMPDELYEDPF